MSANLTIERFRDFAENGIRPNDTGKDTVVNVDADGKLSGRVWVAWGSRDEAMLRANLKARRAFAAALTAKFNVTKMSDLPKLVRDELKLDDFDLDENGNVRSWKPLTAYRVRCVTDAVERVEDAGKRMALAERIVKESLTPKCAREFVSLAKAGKLGSAKALTDFVDRHFGGKTGARLEAVLVNSRHDRQLLLNGLAQGLVEHVRPALVEAGVTGEQLGGLVRAISEFPAEPELNGLSARAVAEAFAVSLFRAAKEIGRESFGACLNSQQERLEMLPAGSPAGSFGENMKTERGRDLLLREAIGGLDDVEALNSPARRVRLNSLLSYLADHVKELGSAHAYVLTVHLKMLIDVGGPDGRMQARQLLGTMLKRSTDLTDADVRQFPVMRLRDYALAAADDSLVGDRKVLVDSWKRVADEIKRQNYTDAETRELMAFAREVAVAGQPVAVAGQPVAVPDVAGRPEMSEKEKKALADNRLVCDMLNLIGNLMHREDVWTVDAQGGAQAVMDTLNRNLGVVNAMKEHGAGITALSLGTRTALNGMVNPQGGVLSWLQEDKDNPFTDAIFKINTAIRNFADATTDEAKMAACATISEQVDVFARGFAGCVQKTLAENLDSALKAAGFGSDFKDLAAGEDPKNADLLRLAKSRHPEPRNETKEHRQQREAAILADYAKLAMDPQAGGLGALIHSLATNYMKKLDVREQRAMIAGALMSFNGETLTRVLGKESALILAWKASTGSIDEVTRRFSPGPDGKLPRAMRDFLGEVTGGILKGAGPVLQKMVQMLGVEKLPPFLRKAVKDCKSNLKPIPGAYVDAKLKEIVRQSNGRIRSLTKVKSLGAASIAEAFRCRLEDARGRTRFVVVKMLRPDVRGRMEREIAAIRESVKGAGEVANRTLNARISSLLEELDFSVERANIQSCQDIYGRTPYACLGSVKLAEGCPQLPDVLLMEEAPGTTCQKYMDEAAASLERLLQENAIGRDRDGHYKFTNMANGEEFRASLLKMYADVRKRQANLQRLLQVWLSNALFGNGKFHGDLHGGNIMVDKDGNLTVIDFGNAPTFAPKDRKSVLKMLVSAIRGKTGDLLDAVKSLVSAESQRELERNRATLVRRLNDLFAVGGLERAGERLPAVLGELARSGVEVPESLYNFTEAFGRIQQLSDSMTTVLERISGAVPYIRKHQNDVPAEGRIRNPDNHWDGAPADQIVDEILKIEIRTLRRGEPNITDREIFGRLRKRLDSGVFDRVFSSYRQSNPLFWNVMHFFGEQVNGTGVFWMLLTGARNMDAGEKPVQASEEITAWSHRCIKGILLPYCRIRPELGKPLGRLTNLLGRAFDKRYMAGSLMRFFSFELTEKLADPREDSGLFDENVQYERVLDEISKDDTVRAMNLSDEAKRTYAREIAAMTVEFRKLMCDEVMPILVDCYKDRMRQVLDGADLSLFPPPVTMKDTLWEAVSIPSAIAQVGLANVVGLGADLLWNWATSSTIEIRANFGVKLDSFRKFAKADDGRLHATKSKRLEATTYKDARSVHNAEARRALEESLLKEAGLSAQEFYATPAGRRIAALLGLGKGETMSDVEKAPPLTPELLRQILAVFDMRGCDTSPQSVAAILKRFGITGDKGALWDITYERFREVLDAAFMAEFGVPAEKALKRKDGEPDELTGYFRANYGKILKRMADIGGADPRFAKTGKGYATGDVNRWLVGALLGNLTPEKKRKFLGPNAVVPNPPQGLSAQMPLYTALLLKKKGDPSDFSSLVEFVRMMVPSGLFAKFHEPLSPSDPTLAEELDKRGTLCSKLAQDADEETRARHKKASELARKLGLGVLSLAADNNLYTEYRNAKTEDLKKRLRTTLESRVRTALYVWNERPPRRVDEQTETLLAFWEAKHAFETPPSLLDKLLNKVSGVFGGVVKSMFSE